MMLVAGGEVIHPGDLKLARFFCFGYSFTTTPGMDEWMRRFERGHLNCLWRSSLGIGKSCSRSYRLVGFPSFEDLQLARFFVLGVAPPPTELWTNGCDSLKEHS